MLNATLIDTLFRWMDLAYIYTLLFGPRKRQPPDTSVLVTLCGTPKLEDLEIPASRRTSYVVRYVCRHSSYENEAVSSLNCIVGSIRSPTSHDSWDILVAGTLGTCLVVDFVQYGSFSSILLLGCGTWISKLLSHIRVSRSPSLQLGSRVVLLSGNMELTFVHSSYSKP